jgi:hypothetical protein
MGSKKMKLEVTTGKIDEFTLSTTEFCVDKDYNIFEVWVSEKTYTVGCYMGKMRVVVKDGEVLAWIYPMLNAPDPYDLIQVSSLGKWNKIIEAYNSRKKKADFFLVPCEGYKKGDIVRV